MKMLFNDFKQAPEIPEVTNYLANNKKFEKLSIEIDNLKLKFWQKLDEAAFPEEYEDKKHLEEKNKNQKNNVKK